MEDRSSRRSLGPDSASMRLHESPRNSQTQSSANRPSQSGAARSRPLGAVKALEDALQIFRLNPWTSVADQHVHDVAFGVCLNAHGSASGRVVERVVDQVAKHSLES